MFIYLLCNNVVYLMLLVVKERFFVFLGRNRYGSEVQLLAEHRYCGRGGSGPCSAGGNKPQVPGTHLLTLLH
jgi:hypothetical protein